MNAQDRGAEPAYPWSEHGTVLGGLTVREAFAMAAMQGLCAADCDRSYQAIANEAVMHADELLAALNQEPRT